MRTSFEEWTLAERVADRDIRVKVEQDVVIDMVQPPIDVMIKEMAIPQRIKLRMNVYPGMQRVSRSSFMTTDKPIPVAPVDDILAEAADTTNIIYPLTDDFAARMGSDTYDVTDPVIPIQAEIQRAMVRLMTKLSSYTVHIATDALNVATNLETRASVSHEFFKTFGFDYELVSAETWQVFTYHYRDYKCDLDLPYRDYGRYRYSYNRHKLADRAAGTMHLMSADELYDEISEIMVQKRPGRFNALINYYTDTHHEVIGMLIKRWVGFDEMEQHLPSSWRFKGYSGVALDKIPVWNVFGANGDTLKLTSKELLALFLYAKWMHIVARGQYNIYHEILNPITAIDPEAIERWEFMHGLFNDLDRRLSLTQYPNLPTKLVEVQKEINLAYNNPVHEPDYQEVNYTERDSGRDLDIVSTTDINPTTGSDDDLTPLPIGYQSSPLLTGWGMPAVGYKVAQQIHDIRYWERNSGKEEIFTWMIDKELHEFMPYLTLKQKFTLYRRLQFTTETHSYYVTEFLASHLAFYMQQYPVWPGLIMYIRKRAAHVRFMADGWKVHNDCFVHPALVEPQETSLITHIENFILNPIDIAYAIRVDDCSILYYEYIDDLIAEYPDYAVYIRGTLTTQNLSRHKKTSNVYRSNPGHAIDKPIYITSLDTQEQIECGFVSENRETWRYYLHLAGKPLIVKSESIAQQMNLAITKNVGSPMQRFNIFRDQAIQLAKWTYAVWQLPRGRPLIY
ncbi:hypothetical protein SPFM20_00200 [Salmonella phage SPFM20]|nr:hypothetical protein SPFM20_00200 [Salmonella phage SPFM20]